MGFFSRLFHVIYVVLDAAMIILSGVCSYLVMYASSGSHRTAALWGTGIALYVTVAVSWPLIVDLGCRALKHVFGPGALDCASWIKNQMEVLRTTGIGAAIIVLVWTTAKNAIFSQSMFVRPFPPLDKMISSLWGENLWFFLGTWAVILAVPLLLKQIEAFFCALPRDLAILLEYLLRSRR